MTKLLLFLVLLGGCSTIDFNSTEVKEVDSIEVKEVDYRYEVRIGFSDYTYSNGTWKDVIFSCRTPKEAYEYVVKYNSSYSDLIIYDIKTGETFEETP